MPRHITPKQVIERFESLNPGLHIISDVGTRSNDEIWIHCDKCNCDFPRIRRNVLRRIPDGCSVCNGYYIVKGVNDIATTHPHLVKYFANIEDAYSYSKGSHTKVCIKCPYCKNEQKMQVKNLVNQGFKCHVCDSGISYPNRFAREMLRQLPIDNWICEYSPEWVGRKYYDNYFEYKGNKYILEMDGELGHIKTFTHDATLNGIINDNYKDNRAIEHGIKVIRIDCKDSSPKYIINNIMKSELSKMFDLSIDNLMKCAAKATDNLFVQICKYYEQGQKSNQEIIDHFKVSMSTVCKALKVGGEVGIIKYSNEIARKKAGKNGALKQQNRVEIVVDLYKHNEYLGRFNNIMSALRKVSETYPDIKLKSVSTYVYRYNKYKEFKFIRRNENERDKVC